MDATQSPSEPDVSKQERRQRQWDTVSTVFSRILLLCFLPLIAYQLIWSKGPRFEALISGSFALLNVADALKIKNWFWKLGFSVAAVGALFLYIWLLRQHP